MGTILVKRDDPADIRLRDLYVQVDDLPERTLQFGGQFSFDLPSGTHRIRATNRLFAQTRDFEITGEEEIEFAATNVWMKGLLSALFVVSGTGAYRVKLSQVR
jgi:hypothetical protein